MWYELFRVNPLLALQTDADIALLYWLNRDVIRSAVEPVESLWELPEPIRILKKQQRSGAWRYSGKSSADTNYDLLETFRLLRLLVVQYGLNRSHPQIERAAAYVLSCQTDEGDIRGILGNQLMPYYHGMFLELLIRSGYQDDERVIRGLEWLLAMRQDDGGWIVPAQTMPASAKTREWWMRTPLLPERTRPHAHLATGMALRPFACHPQFRMRDEVTQAAIRLKERFFRPDKYNDRKSVGYWTKFQYPYWWTNVLMALDSLTCIGFQIEDADIRRAVKWFMDHQATDGLWPTGYDKGASATQARQWVGLAVCTVLRRLYN